MYIYVYIYIYIRSPPQGGPRFASTFLHFKEDASKTRGAILCKSHKMRKVPKSPVIDVSKCVTVPFALLFLLFGQTLYTTLIWGEALKCERS